MVFEKKKLKIFFYKLLCNILTPKWPNSTLGDNDLNKIEFTLPKDASTQIIAFLAYWILKRRFKKILIYIFFICQYKIRPPSPGDHELGKHECTLSEDATII